MKSIKILVWAICLGILLTFTSSVYAAIIRDPSPVNIAAKGALYDYRDVPHYTSAPGGSGMSGAYFFVNVGVIEGNFLSNHSDVTSITAKHLNTGFQYSLERDACDNWLGLGRQYWYLFLRPEDWMFEGNWRFYMYYNGSDGNVHLQIADVAAGPKAFPCKPSNIQIVKSDTGITVSWSAIGNPATGPFDYRIRVYDDAGVCPVVEYIMSTDGVYDGTLNKVTFTLPLDYSWYKITLENWIKGGNSIGRAQQFTRLP